MNLPTRIPGMVMKLKEKEDGSLLSVKDVASLLNISTRTVYDHVKELGGFYLCDINVLRFSREYIHEYLERSQKKTLEVSVPVSGRKLLRKGIQNRKGIKGGGSRAQKTIERENEQVDRHGFFALSRQIYDLHGKKNR